MNYQKIHDSIVERAVSRKTLDGYFETHHIIPKCLGGTDAKENLVVLTAREHYLVHWLLHKLNPKNKGLAFAWFSFIASYERVGRFTSHTFEYAKRAMAKAQSERMKGEGNHFYGRKHTEESKRKVSESRIGLKNPNHKGYWQVDGVNYLTCREASSKVGVPTTTLRFRMKSKTFPNYLFIKTNTGGQ